MTLETPDLFQPDEIPFNLVAETITPGTPEPFQAEQFELNLEPDNKESDIRLANPELNRNM